jgi:hypothetical protein
MGGGGGGVDGENTTFLVRLLFTKISKIRIHEEKCTLHLLLVA